MRAAADSSVPPGRQLPLRAGQPPTADDGMLLARLRAFVFDDPGDRLPFTVRLAQENGWTRAYAQRVVDEYRRFVWLALRAGHPVTPSPAVDEAWHLHLCYTRSYWQRFCGDVLGRPLHHEPTRGGEREDGKFATWYGRTLASYRAHFGEPPADVWPAPGVRFRGGAPRKVDAARHFVIERVRVRRIAAVGAAVTALVALGGCSGRADNGALLAVAGVVVVGVLVAVLVRRASKRERSDDLVGTGCGGQGAGGSSPRDAASDDGGDGGAGGDGDGGGSSGCGGGGGD